LVLIQRLRRRKLVRRFRLTGSIRNDGLLMSPASSHVDRLEAEILTRLAAGEVVVSRLVTMMWFTYETDGESYVVGAEMRQRLEDIAGAELIEFTPADYPADRALGFRTTDLSLVREAIAARGIPAAASR
jgi:hypothetical protein